MADTVDRSLIGQWGPEGTMRVELGKVREFAKAVKDDNPVFRDPEKGLAPPTFLMTIAHWIGDLGATRSAVKLDYRRLLHGEQSFRYHAMAYAGDRLRFEARIADIYDKKGGALEFVLRETTVTNQNGVKVADLTCVTVVRND